jgi:hypothetical protein
MGKMGPNARMIPPKKGANLLRHAGGCKITGKGKGGKRGRAARLAAILVGESPTSIGVQSML